MQEAQGHLPLSAGTLEDGSYYGTGANMGDESGKQVRRNDGQTLQNIGIACGLQHWNRSFRSDVDSRQIRTLFKQFAALSIGFLLDVMIFDWFQELKIGIEGIQSGLEGGIFFRMLRDCHVKNGDSNRASPVCKKSAHEIGCNRATGEGVYSDDAEATAIGRVCGHADHGNLSAGCPPNPGAERLWATRESNDPVDLLLDRRLECFLLALAQSWIGSKLNLDILQQ